MNFREFKLYHWLRKNQFLFFLKRRLLNGPYKRALKRMNTSPLTKSKKQIKQEMQLVADYWHCKPYHYVRYGLFDREISIEDLLDYIPPYYIYNFHNKPLSQEVKLKLGDIDSKLDLYRLFNSRGIQTSKVKAVLSNRKLYDPDDVNHALRLEDLFMDLDWGRKLFFKPVKGEGGDGIVMIEKISDTQVKCNDKLIDIFNVFEVLNNQEEYVVQEGIIQRSDIAKINPSSVNTLRVITQWRDGSVVIAVCVLRMGRGGKFVDNSHQGGLSVLVDKESGVLAGLASMEVSEDKLDRHPDSGVLFHGYKIEDWTSTKSQILAMASKIPEVQELAWDIAIEDSGALAIEINYGYGIDHLQCCAGGMRRVLNIYPY